MADLALPLKKMTHKIFLFFVLVWLIVHSTALFFINFVAACSDGRVGKVLFLHYLESGVIPWLSAFWRT